MFQLRWVWARLKSVRKRYVFALFSTVFLAVAVMGPTGGGKTSLVNLIPRFVDVTSGALSVETTLPEALRG